MQRYSEAEQCFLQDVKEKKKAASGVHSKTGKRGYVGKMLFPTDLMTRKEKYHHRKAGKVMTTNMYDKILTFAEFNELETYEKKNRMQHWRLNNTIKIIQKEMGIPNQRYYDILRELELPLDRTAKKVRAPRTAKTVAVVTKQAAAPEPAAEAIAAPAPVPEAATPVQQIILNGLNVSFNGTYDAEVIQKQLLKVLTLLDGETDNYYVEMKLMQKTK